jgi:PAS domain S-box-containing protein
MSDSVLLVCADAGVRVRVRDALAKATGPGVTVTTATRPAERDARCVVGVPGDDPTGFTRRLAERASAPVIVFGSVGDEATDVLAAGADDVVARDDGANAVLAHRIDQITDAPTARGVAVDGGGAATAGRPPGDAVASLERMADGFLTLDGDREVTYVNGAAREMLGDSGGLVGEHASDVFPADDGQIRDGFDRAVKTGEMVAFETSDPDRGRWFEVRAYPAEEGLSAFVQDVTERKRAREELQASERALQRLHELAADADRTRAEKIAAMLAVGRDRLDIELGFLTRIEDGTQEIVESVGDHPDIQPGATAPLSEAYCRHTIGREEPLGITDATEGEMAEDPAYERFGLACYLGATIFVDGEQYGTVCFAGAEPRRTEFSESERTFIDLLTDWISYILEQRQYEERVRANRRRLETVTENVPVVVFALDPDGTVTLARGRGLEEIGFQPDQAVGESVFDLFDGDAVVVKSVEQALAGEETHHTVEVEGDTTIELWYQPVIEGGKIQQIVGVARDISELADHRRRLSGLLDTTRSLMQARSREVVADFVANAAGDVLGFHINVVRLYDAEAEALAPAAKTAATEEHMNDRPVYDVGEGVPGEVFATGESRIIEDLQTTDVDPGTEDIRSTMYYPMGVHGTISVGSTEPGAFDEADEQALALLATAAAAACTRAKREREVREAREHVETVLDRVNGLIENTVEVLVGATTRGELEDGVVGEMAAAEPYTFAWIGRPDVTSETLSPTDWAGTGSVPVAGQSFDLEGPSAVATALEEGVPQIVSCGDDLAPALGCTEGADAEACMIVPLAYKDATYGAIAVFAAEPGAFDEREQVVLSALGRAVANAINAIERGRILDADEVIELEFTIDAPSILFGELSRREGCTVEVADTDYRADGTQRLYLTVDEADGEVLTAAARDSEAVIEATLITDHEEECLLELTVEESLIGWLSEYGAVVRGLVAENGRTRVTVELPYEAEARELFEMVEARYSGADLVGYHEHERPVQTRQEFRATLADRFTDRQETALRTAYLGGFFDWPRDINGNDLADAMGISRPTYHQHLRAAQRKVLEELFDGST